MGGCLGKEQTAPQNISCPGENADAFPLYGVPGIAADFGKLQPAVGFNLLHHRAEGVHMGGQAPPGAIRLTRQCGDQSTLAGTCQLDSGQGG